MAKFKVGDRVRGIAAHDGKREMIGTAGTIIAVVADDCFAVSFDKDIDGHACIGRCTYGYGWNCSADTLELISPNMTGAKIIIFTQGNKVIAKLIKDKEVLGVGSAQCSPDDEFNFLTGAQIALARLGQAYNSKSVLLKEALKGIEII